MSDSRFSLQRKQVSTEQLDAILMFEKLSEFCLFPCTLRDSVSGIEYEAFLFLNPDHTAQFAFNDIDCTLESLLQKENVQGIIDKFAYSLRDTMSESEQKQFDLEMKKGKLNQIFSQG
jgi:hypothetical protein